VRPFTRWLIAIALCGGCLGAATASGAVQVFINDYAGFQDAAGPLLMIDFQTLPDGSPSEAGIPITKTFNYDAQGAHFSSPLTDPFIVGNVMSQFGFDLATRVTFPQRTWIDAQLTTPARAVGVLYPGTTRLFTYDVAGQLIAQIHYGAGGGGNFLGIISDIPIHYARVDRGSDIEDLHSFMFVPVPEPGSAMMLLFGAVLVRLPVARSR
jgi:hypothetical protein